MKRYIMVVGVLTIASLLSLFLKTNTIITISTVLAIVIMQFDNLFVCYKVTDLMQNENKDLYERYRGPYSLFKKKRLVLNSIWFTKNDRDKLSDDVKRLFLRQRIDFLCSVFCVFIWVILILILSF